MYLQKTQPEKVYSITIIFFNYQILQYLTSVNVVDDNIHDTGFNSVNSDDIVATLQQLEEDHGPGLEYDRVAVELLLLALDDHVRVVLGAETGEGGQEPVRLLDHALHHADLAQGGVTMVRIIHGQVLDQISL